MLAHTWPSCHVNCDTRVAPAISQKASRKQRLWQMHYVWQEAELEDLKAGKPERI